MNPFRTRKFADMMGQLAKTDEIDARTLALFGAMVKPKTTPPPTQEAAQLAELLTARRQVGTEMTTLKVQGVSVKVSWLRAKYVHGSKCASGIKKLWKPKYVP